MLDLIKELIAYKYACKIKHWQSTTYSEHLLYDRLAENVDDYVDALAEKVFMAAGETEKLNSEILDNARVNIDILEQIGIILEKIDDLTTEDKTPEGVPSLLGDISKDFLTKLAIARLK